MGNIYNNEWKQELYALIQKARSEGKWLWCSYQDLWFSPDDLEKHHREGRFMWGVTNWQLRDPIERLNEADRHVQNAIKKRERIAKEIGVSSCRYESF